jgi:hypothetical protein
MMNFSLITKSLGSEKALTVVRLITPAPLIEGLKDCLTRLG